MRPTTRKLPPVRAAWRRLGRQAELNFWRSRPDLVSDGQREWVYTECFDIGRDWFRDKRILDVGCGPRGSLDWARDAAARVGLDPLAEEYLALGVDPDAMEYVEGVAEAMPFPANSFDVVASINSLDHVDDVAATSREITRVLRPGGLFLLATEVNHRARLTEPQRFGWEIVESFSPPLEVVDAFRWEDSGAGIDLSLSRAVPYREDEPPHAGVLVAKLQLPGR